MRVFLDASVWLAALGRPEGGSGELLNQCEAGEVVPIVTGEVLAETLRNAGKVGATPADLEALVLRVRPLVVAIRAADLEAWPGIIEKDRHVIAGASLGKVDFLVTFDRRHLANPKTREAVPFLIGDAGEFLNWLASHPRDSMG